LIKSNSIADPVLQVAEPGNDALQVNGADAGSWNHAPHTDWSQMADTEHFVQFYEADGFLLNSLSGSIARANCDRITSGRS